MNGLENELKMMLEHPELIVKNTQSSKHGSKSSKHSS